MEIEQTIEVDVLVASADHMVFAEEICEQMAVAAKIRGTGIAKRAPEYICKKMDQGEAVIALSGQTLAGFCYIESWDTKKYVANSGLIVCPEFRRLGLARRLKTRAFELSRELFPEAKIFGITTSLAVMKINSDLGYRPVTFSELTQDEVFWKGCQSCPNHDVLERTRRQYCLCTGMLFDPAREGKDKPGGQ